MNGTVIRPRCTKCHRCAERPGREVAGIQLSVVQHDAVGRCIDVVPHDGFSSRHRRGIRRERLVAVFPDHIDRDGIGRQRIAGAGGGRTAVSAAPGDTDRQRSYTGRKEDSTHDVYPFDIQRPIGVVVTLTSAAFICPCPLPQNSEQDRHHYDRDRDRGDVVRGRTHPTTMRPVIFGCSEQKYWYAPGASNRCENCPSVSSTGDLNFCSVLTTTWGTSSRFVQVMVVPTGTVEVAGVKLKLSTATSFAPPVGISASSGMSVIAIG